MDIRVCWMLLLLTARFDFVFHGFRVSPAPHAAEAIASALIGVRGSRS
jgi:hypothetical protein